MNVVIRAAVIGIFALAFAAAHETQTVGDGPTAYKIIVGYSTEPAYTDERNGLDLFIRTVADEPVENLENSLTATLVAPNGSTRVLSLRPVYGKPGDYTDDFILTAPGSYRLLLTGFIGATEIGLTFDFHDVAPLSDLRFP